MNEDPNAAYWERAGRDGAAALDGVWSVLVVGDDADAVARAALGLGRVQAARRRVAIGDLIGEAPPLQSLVRGDDPHGLVDSFRHGVSLNRVARRTDDGGNLFVLPSGTEPEITEDIFRSPRWRRLASGFREVGALLVLAAPASAPGVEDLAASLDGVIIVGRADALPEQARARTLATIPEAIADEPALEIAEPEGPLPLPLPVAGASLAPGPLHDIPRATAGPAAADPSGGGLAATPPSGAPPVEAPTPRVPRQTPLPPPPEGPKMGDPRPRPRMGPPPSSPWLIPALAGTAVVGLGFYLMRARDLPPPNAADDLPPAAVVAPAPRADSVGSDSAGVIAPAVINPADSGRASAYAIELWQSTTFEGAAARVERDWPTLPAVSITPIVTRGDSVSWYKVRAGAYADSNTAASRRATLRARGGGTLDLPIVRAPYALRLLQGISVDTLATYARELRAKQVPAYVLLQLDGRVNVYAGAFETVAEAAAYRRTLRRLGILPPIAFRVGEPYGMPRTP